MQPDEERRLRALPARAPRVTLHLRSGRHVAGMRHVTLRANDTSGVTLDGEVLSFAAPLARGAAAVPDAAELTSHVEALF